MLDFFVGGGKKSTGPTTVKVMPMTINMTNRFQGNITALYRYKDIIFWNPGSNNAGFDLNEYPYYNEVMGTLNLLRTPVVNRKITTEFVYPEGGRSPRYTLRTYTYRVPNDIEYILNPAAGLTIQDLKLALIVEGPVGPVAGGGFHYFESYDAATNKYQFRSDYVDINCFKQTFFDIQAYDEPGHINWHPDGKMYIKVMANLRRADSDSNTQNVFFVAKYPVTVQNSSNLGTISACAPVPPRTQAAVQTYCTTAYTGSTRFLRYKENLEEILKEEKLKQQNLKEEEYNEGLAIFPNPANNKATLRYSVSLSQHVKLEVKDLLGRNILTLADHWSAPGNYEIELFTEKFPTGVYILLLETSDKIITKQFIVNK